MKINYNKKVFMTEEKLVKYLESWGCKEQDNSTEYVKSYGGENIDVIFNRTQFIKNNREVIDYTKLTFEEFEIEFNKENEF